MESDTIDTLSCMYEEIEFLRSHPEECGPNDIPDVEDLIQYSQEDFQEYIRSWKPEGDPDLFEEVKNIAEWIDFKRKLLSGSEPEYPCSEQLQKIHVEEVFSRCGCNGQEKTCEYCL